MSPHRDRLFRPLARRIFPRVPDFHGLLLGQCEVVADGLDALEAFLAGRNLSRGDRVRAVEEEGDRRRARTLETLARAFATPFDRDSIYTASVALDDILDYAKSTVREIEVLDLEPDAWMVGIAGSLREGAIALREGFALLRDEPETARRRAIDVHRAERAVERDYRAAVAEGFSAERYDRALREGGPPAVAPAFADLLAALRRREVYRHLSNAADRLDAAGRALTDIVVREA